MGVQVGWHLGGNKPKVKLRWVGPAIALPSNFHSRSAVRRYYSRKAPWAMGDVPNVLRGGPALPSRHTHTHTQTEEEWRKTKAQAKFQIEQPEASRRGVSQSSPSAPPSFERNASNAGAVVNWAAVVFSDATSSGTVPPFSVRKAFGWSARFGRNTT